MYIAAFVMLLLALSCQGGSSPTLRFLNESAKEDLDKASLVVLATVNAVSDQNRPPAPAGYRRMEVTLDVQRVIKGELATRTPCVTYYALNGGIVGHLPVWVEPGSTGIFFLSKAEPCFRAVNDNRTYIRAYSTLPTTPVSPEKLIAEATVPRGCAGNSYIYTAQQDVWSETIPLVGSRAARKLLLASHHGDGSGIMDCSCLVAAMVWRLPESCLASRSTRDEIQQQAQRIKASNNELNLQEERLLRDNPAVWLKTTVEGMGMDGALLRLGGLMSFAPSSFSKGTCAVLKKARKSVSFETSLAKGRGRSNETAEKAAVGQFGRWLDGDCRADWQLLENPLIDP